MNPLARLFGRSKARADIGAGPLAAGYEASRLSRRLRGWQAERRTINALMSSGGEQLRARARQLCRENPYAANACEAFVSAAVGSGIKPSSLVSDKAEKAAIAKAFLRWTDEADADGLTDFYGLQALAARAMFEAGECFIRFRPRLASDGLSVPLQLQLLESEMLPLDHNAIAPSGDIIRCGIQFNAIGKRVAYHFLKTHPGEMTLAGYSGEKTVVPASEVLHLYRPLRPGQVRGQPEITPGMVRLYLLDQYDDAELDRKRVAAMFAGFVTKAAPTDGDAITGGNPAQLGETALAGLEPGTLQVLLPGEDVKFSNPAEVGGSYEAFQYRTLLAITAAVGLPYHSVTGDVNKANYSSLRAAQLDTRRRMDQFQHLTLVYQFCRPVWTRWFETAVLAGAVPIAANRFSRDRADLVAAKWIPPRWEWVDPLKDRQAQALAEDRGWFARSDSIEAEGYDPEEVDARIQADQAREAELGLHFPRPERVAGVADDPVAPPEATAAA